MQNQLMIETWIQYTHLEKLYGYLPGLDEALMARLFGLGVEEYREVRGRFDANARDAAREILEDASFAGRVDRLPFRAGETVVGPAPCEVVRVPRVEEAGVSMECILDRVLPLGTDHLVIGRMIRFHVRDELYGENERIDVSSLDPLGRLAGNYTKVETIFKLPADEL